MEYQVDANESGSRRHRLLGAITIVALFGSVLLAILAKKQTDVPFVVVAPINTAIELDGAKPRILPSEPRGSATQATYYFRAKPGEHEVILQHADGRILKQVVTISASDYPVIYTLLNDSLHEMRARSR